MGARKTVDPTQFKLNWVPNPKDPRDHTYADKLMAAGFDMGALPESFDLRNTKWLSGIQNQTSLGSCVGQSVNACMEFIRRKSGQETDFEGSALYAYWNARWYSRSTRSDSGAYIRYGAKGAVDYGVCRAKLWPYVESKYAAKPTAEAYADGNRRDVTEFVTFKGAGYTDQIHHALAVRQVPVITGFTCPASLHSSATTRTGIVEPLKRGERVVGGHAVIIVGYDKPRDLYPFKNSWSESWGDDGYGYLRGEYLRDMDLADDYTALLAAE